MAQNLYRPLHQNAAFGADYHVADHRVGLPPVVLLGRLAGSVGKSSNRVCAATVLDVVAGSNHLLDRALTNQRGREFVFDGNWPDP